MNKKDFIKCINSTIKEVKSNGTYTCIALGDAFPLRKVVELYTKTINPEGHPHGRWYGYRVDKYVYGYPIALSLFNQAMRLTSLHTFKQIVLKHKMYKDL